MNENENWDVYKTEYEEGTCEVCGTKGQVTIIDNKKLCRSCTVDWLIKKATE